MACLFLDSFDHYATAQITQKWTSQSVPNGSIVISAGNGRATTASLRVTPGFASGEWSVTKAFPGVATVILGTAFRSNSFSAMASGTVGGHIFFRYTDGTVQVALRFNVDGSINAYRGTTLLGTSSPVLQQDVYSYIEAKVTVSNTVGVVEIRVNGTVVLNLTSQDTNNATASDLIHSVTLGHNASSTASPALDFDDVYLCNTAGSVNNNFLGPIRVKVILPDGAGASTDFTPSAGSNFQNVDDALTDSDTTYNSETTPGDHDTYAYAALGLTGVVKAVQTNLVVRSDGAGAETVRPKIRIGGVDYNGTTVGVTTAYVDKCEVFDTSPATATAWTVSEIDGAEFGLELVS